jgi:hypothetical protein
MFSKFEDDYFWWVHCVIYPSFFISI